MTKLFTVTALCVLAPFSFAQPLSDSNPVERALVLQSGEVALGAGLYYGETRSEENKFAPSFELSYGLTENLTIGPIGARYSVMQRSENKTGLELAIEGGLMGLYEVTDADDSFAVGVGLNGKYVFNSDVALTFESALVHWAEDSRPNRKEARVSLGSLWQLQPGFTLSASLHYRKFKDFEQDHSTAISTNLIWALSPQWDITFSAAYSDFNPLLNGYEEDVEYQQQAGVSAVYRF